MARGNKKPTGTELGYEAKLWQMADALRNPAYSTSVGLLQLGLEMDSAAPLETGGKPNGNGGPRLGGLLGNFLKRLLPDNDE